MTVAVNLKGVGMKGYLKTTKVAERFGVTTRTVLRWVQDGYFPGARKQNPKAKNSPILIPESAIEDFERQQIITPEG